MSGRVGEVAVDWLHHRVYLGLEMEAERGWSLHSCDLKLVQCTQVCLVFHSDLNRAGRWWTEWTGCRPS